MKILHRIWEDIKHGENIDHYLSIIAAITLSLLNLTGIVPQEILTPITLAVLGLLAISSLINRDKFEKLGNQLTESSGSLQREIEKLEDTLVSGGNNPSLMFEPDLLKDTPFRKYIQGAHELFISGGSLVGFFKNEREVIEQWLSETENAKFRVILLSPQEIREGRVSVESLYRDRTQDHSNYASDTERALEIINVLQKKHPAKIDVRLVNEVPSVSVLMVDRSKARISINLYLVYPTHRPVFSIDKTTHPKWFKLFEEKYYIQLWESSTPLHKG